MVNNILQIDEDAFEGDDNANSPSRILLALDAYITALQLSGAGNFSEVQSSIAVRAITVPRDSLSDGLGFASLQGVSDELDESRISLFTGRDSSLETEASIFLPGEILQYIPEGGYHCLSFPLHG